MGRYQSRAVDRLHEPDLLGLGQQRPLLSLANVQVFEQSKLQFSIAEAQFLNAQQDLILRVSDAYFDVLASANSLRTIQSEKRAISEQLAAAKRNFEVGTATITDQQEAQARFDLTVARELAALNDLDIKRSALSLLTGKPVTEVSDPQSGITLTQPEPADEGNWIQSRATRTWACNRRSWAPRWRAARSPASATPVIPPSMSWASWPMRATRPQRFRASTRTRARSACSWAFRCTPAARSMRGYAKRRPTWTRPAPMSRSPSARPSRRRASSTWAW
ncbi:MAG: TolC family protein [Burkholderiaceae bacterium]